MIPTRADEEVQLNVLAEQRMLLVVRMTLAGMGAQCGMNMDQLEDIRTAADEACYCLMHQPRQVRRLRMCCACQAGQLQVTLTGERGETLISDHAAHDPEVARCILSTLVPDVRLEHDDYGVHTIVLTFPCDAG